MGHFNLQGLVLFGLYMSGIVSALCFHRDEIPAKDKSQHALLLELPSYRIPDLKSVGIGLLDRAKIFLKACWWHHFCAVDSTVVPVHVPTGTRGCNPACN